MGDARRRRLALIAGGKSEEAKAMFVAPERLTNLTTQMPTHQAEILQKIYDDKVSKATCPTFNSFLLAVIEAGVIEFERFYLLENAPPLAPASIDASPEEGGEA